jgi:hypothetical protein
MSTVGMSHIARAAMLLAVLSASCASAPGRAHDFFAHQWTCPADRVEVARRHDLRGQPVVPPEPPPPPEVSADPERVKLWRQQWTEKLHATWPHPCDVYEVRGCNQRELVCCFTREDYTGVGDNSQSNAYCYRGLDEAGGIKIKESAVQMP